jgi:hypothetical protein
VNLHGPTLKLKSVLMIRKPLIRINPTP